MNIVEIINKKRLGKVLTREELEYAFLGYLNKEIPDYQMSALLMAIALKSMSEEEVINLTDIYISSGDVIDLSDVSRVKVDKHSTGGVGDKTTLIVAPIVASCGIVVPKMSGRGLGHTGGTIDKLESIPGMKTSLTREEFINQLNSIYMAVISQTDDLVPLDRLIYVLRDVTGTVESVPLIAASIMSKKIASGADKILIDIKLGNGALIKTQDEAERLKHLIEAIAAKYEKEVRCVMTDMNAPLGRAVGNSLEVAEAIEVLQGHEIGRLYDICLLLASQMISMAKGCSAADARMQVNNAIASGRAYEKFLDFVEAQGGNLDKMSVSTQVVEYKSPVAGVVDKIDALKAGEVSLMLGAGRKIKEDKINPKVGIVFDVEIGDEVEVGTTLCRLYTANGNIDGIDVASIFEILTAK